MKHPQSPIGPRQRWRQKMLALGGAVGIAVGLVTGPGAAQVQMGALNPATEKAIRDVAAAAARSFAGLPPVRLTSALDQLCDGDALSSRMARYCTDLNVIYVDAGLADRFSDPRAAAYVVAHMYGHAVQVRHGVADVALATIRAERDREAELRGMVTAQVDCIAGVLYGRAGLSGGGLEAWFADEPFTGSHWGRSPMSGGPRVSIGLEARDQWFQAGARSGDLASCAVGDFGAEMLLRAER